MTTHASITVEDGVLVRRGQHRVDVGDIDQNRNLKIRTFIGPGLRPVFEDLQEKLQFRKMGSEEGVAPGQYYQEFEAYPRPLGFDETLQTELQISLQSALVAGRDGPGERLIVETRSTLSSRVATAPPSAVGFAPPLGEIALAGRGRVIHMLTRPKGPPGARSVTEVPRQLSFLTPRPFADEFPTLETLSQIPERFYPTGAQGLTAVHGVWTMANSDVFLHVHAREYLYAMENRMGALAADAGLPLDRISATGSKVIFRRPSLVGERYELRCQLYRRENELLALGSFHTVTDDTADERPACYLRFKAAIT